MNKTKKYHYKVLGAVLTVALIVGLGSLNINSNLLQGKLTLNTEIDNFQVQVLTEDVKPGEEVELKINQDGKAKPLPAGWEVQVTYFTSPQIESLYASTEATAKAQITKTNDSTYTFYAPEAEGLYKVSLLDEEGQTASVLTKLNVLK